MRHDSPLARCEAFEEPVTVCVSNYNGMHVLEPTLQALRALPEDVDRIVVDDGSTDGSPEWVATRYPEVRVVSMGRNTGRLGAVRNRALREARTRYVMLIDNDVRMTPDCVRELLRVLLSRPKAMCCTLRILDADRPDRIYLDGAGLHYVCLATGLSRGLDVEAAPAGPPRPTIGSGIMLIDRERSQRIGDFDEDYLHGFGEDGEYHFRARISGYEVLHVPTAVCYHVEREHGAQRAYAQIYNRYRILLCIYATRTLWLTAPVLLAFEVALTALSLVRGFFGLRVAALRQIFRERHALRKRRAEVQALRRVSDRAVLGAEMIVAAGGAARSRLMRTGGRLFSAVVAYYWRLVRRWV